MRVGRNNEERKEGERKWTKLYVVKKKTRFLFRNGIKKKKLSTNFENRRKRARNVY